MQKLTELEVKDRVKKFHNGKIVMISPYKQAKTKAEFQCNVCEATWFATPYDVYTKSGCPNCAGSMRKTTEIYKKEVFNLVGNEYTVLGEYNGTHSKIKLKHNECGHEFEMIAKSFISGQRCPNERYKKTAKSNGIPFERIQKIIHEQFNGEYEIVGDFTFTSRKAKIKHSKCGKIFNCQPTRIIQRAQGCPNCYSSKGEDAVREWLEENNFEFEEQFKIPECKNLRPLPFDFCVKTGDSFVLIEYDGIQHFVPKFGQKQLDQIQFTDNIKNQFCIDNNIKLIRIKYKRTSNYQLLKKYVCDSLNKAMTIPSQA